MGEAAEMQWDIREAPAIATVVASASPDRAAIPAAQAAGIRRQE
jgi:hypothetical protein